jgi:hypothetical protein
MECRLSIIMSAPAMARRRHARRGRARSSAPMGRLSAVARQSVPGADRMKYVFAYHEIVKSPVDGRPISTANAAT